LGSSKLEEARAEADAPGSWAIPAANWQGDQQQQGVREQQGIIMFPNSKHMDIDLLAARYG
jgi:hypothetical protein